MNKQELYIKYLQEIEENLLKDEFENLDIFLENIYTSQIPENELEEIYDILQEITLYLEFKETEYKEKAIELIEEFKK